MDQLTSSVFYFGHVALPLGGPSDQREAERQSGREAERGDLCHSFAVRRTSCGPFNFQCRGSGALLAGQCARTLKDEGKAEDEEASEPARATDGRTERAVEMQKWSQPIPHNQPHRRVVS